MVYGKAIAVEVESNAGKGLPKYHATIEGLKNLPNFGKPVWVLSQAQLAMVASLSWELLDAIEAIVDQKKVLSSKELETISELAMQRFCLLETDGYELYSPKEYFKEMAMAVGELMKVKIQEVSCFDTLFPPEGNRVKKLLDTEGMT